MATIRSSSTPSPRRGRLAAFVPLLLVFAAPGLGGAAIEVRGTVVDESGAPLGGARVELQRIEPRHEIGSRLLAGAAPAAAAGAVETSADGGWVLAADGPGMWQIEVRSPGKVALRRRLVPLTEPRELSPAVLAADGGAWIDVVDESGGPVAGARVWMSPSELPASRRRPPSAWRPWGRRATADEAGTAYLSRRRDQAIDVWAFAPGFVPSERVNVAGDRGRVTLRRGQPLQMRFVTAGGEPAAQAIIGVGALQWAAARADAEGRARVFVRAGEPLPIAVHLPSGQREAGTVEAAAEKLARPQDEAEVMTLPPPRVLVGRVVDTATQRPAPGAWVWSAGDPGRVEGVDRAGGYRLIVSSAGYWQIGAAAPGYLPAEERRRHEGDEAGPKIALSPAAAIGGRVTDAAGSGVDGAEIVAVPAGEDPRWSRRALHVSSRGGGRFRLAGIAVGGSYELRVRAAGFAPVRRAVRAEPGVDLEIVLAPGRRLVGRVVASDGASIAGAELVVAAGMESFPGGRFRAATEPLMGSSAADGTFRFDGLPPEPLVLVARHPDFAPAEVPLVDLVPAPPGPGAPPALDLGDVVLEPGAVLQGVVTDTRGDPVAGVQVMVLSIGTPTRPLLASFRFAEPEPITTDPAGRFTVEGLNAGRQLSLTLEHEGYLRHSVDNLFAGDDEVVEIVLERVARVAGTVEDEARRPVPGVSVHARVIGSRGGDLLSGQFRDASREDAAMSADRGRFRLERVAPGSVVLEATGQGHVSAGPVELVLEPGEQREGVVLAVRRGRTLEGTVREVSGRPVADAIVQQGETDGRPGAAGGRRVATSRSDSNGRFVLAGLDPEATRLIVAVHHPEYLTQRHEVDLATGPARLDVVLERGHRVGGRVLGPENEPVAGAAVGLDGGGGVYFSGSNTTVSAADGSFETTGVGPGTYHLFAVKDGFARSAAPEPVAVVDRSLDGLTLTLSRGGTIRGRVLGLEPDELATVRIYASDDGMQHAAGYVAADGSFTVPQIGFARGTVQASVAADGRHVHERFELDPEGGEAWVDLEFDRVQGSTLSGTILFNGEPWRNVQILANGFESGGVGRSGGDGRFEIVGLRDGRHELQLIGGGAMLRYPEPVDVAGNTEVTLEISTVTVRGRVVAAGTGEPVAQAQVTTEGLGPQWMGPWAGTQVETTASGAFELSLPANRRVTLRARAAHRSEANLEIDTGPGPVLEGLELELGDGGELELDVRVASGLTPSWVHAVVVDARGRRLGGEKLFGAVAMPLRIRSVPPGDWTLVVAADGGAQTTVPVKVPGPRLSVVLPPEAVLEVDLEPLADRLGNARLRLLTPAGEPLVLLAFEQLAVDLPVYSLVTELGSLPAGEWIVEVSDDRGQIWRRPAATAAGQTARVVIE